MLMAGGGAKERIAHGFRKKIRRLILASRDYNQKPIYLLKNSINSVTYNISVNI